MEEPDPVLEPAPLVDEDVLEEPESPLASDEEDPESDDDDEDSDAEVDDRFPDFDDDRLSVL